MFLLAASVYGQSGLSSRYDVPFAFHVGEQNFAAGQYTVSSTNPMGVMKITAVSGSGIMVLPQCSIETSAPSLGKLVFHRYGNAYFLSEVWRAGSSEGKQLRKSKAEREIAKAAPPAEGTAVYASVR
jgi:hypothetical protein